MLWSCVIIVGCAVAVVVALGWCAYRIGGQWDE
jgi:hypothetical protein